jgi:hypothetical protein
MKVRWKQGSLRLRITPTELKDLLNGSEISERFDLPGRMIWKVAVTPNAKETSLENTGSVVHFLLSGEDQDKLALPETQGVYFTTHQSDDDFVSYFIEKDFPCLHPRPTGTLEGLSETFTPPSAL